MKHIKYLIFALTVVAIILEALPFGAVLRFATPEETIINNYSYFDMTVFGNANFGPFLTAILSLALLVISFIGLFASSKGIKTAMTVIAFVATAFSLMPLMFGFAYFTVIACVITLIHIVIALLTLLYKKE